MNILLVVDGLQNSVRAADMLKMLDLKLSTNVTILTIIPAVKFLGGVSLDGISNTKSLQMLREEQQKKATELLQPIYAKLQTGKLNLETLVRWGNPAETILDEAHNRNVSLIILGAKGFTDSANFHLGSTALKVMKYARASVLIVRDKIAPDHQESAKKKKEYLKRILLAVDGSKYSDILSHYLLELPLPRPTDVIIITALQSHLEAWLKSPTLDLQANQEILAGLQTAEESEARKIILKVAKQFHKKGYSTASIVARGGASESILAAAKEYDADIIAVGSKGLTGIESFLLGSVAERVARHVECSVLICRETN